MSKEIEKKLPVGQPRIVRPLPVSGEADCPMCLAKKSVNRHNSDWVCHKCGCLEIVDEDREMERCEWADHPADEPWELENLRVQQAKGDGDWTITAGGGQQPAYKITAAYLDDAVSQLVRQVTRDALADEARQWRSDLAMAPQATKRDYEKEN